MIRNWNDDANLRLQLPSRPFAGDAFICCAFVPTSVRSRVVKMLTFAILGIISLFLMSCHPTLSLHLARIEAPASNERVHYYLGRAQPDTPIEKVLLYIEGSYKGPVSQSFGAGAQASEFGYAIAYPERNFTQDPVEFARHDTRDQRIKELTGVLDDLMRRGTQRVVLLAQSEGSMLAPELGARYAPHIAGLICISCSLTPMRHDLLGSPLTAPPFVGMRSTSTTS